MNLPRNGDLTRIYQVVGVAVVGLLAGGGGSVAVDAMNPPRPDPFTGTMAREMRADLMSALGAHDARIRSLEAMAAPCAQRLDHLNELLRDLRIEVREMKASKHP
jgi:hypothetical protein